MELIERGIQEGYVKFDDGDKYITYCHPKKRRNYANPEEKVQVETYLNLILSYNYEPKNIKLFESVAMGADMREADIIVYNEDDTAHIVVECKKEEASELEFNRAIEQAFSYAATGTVRAKYFWVTSKIKNSYFQIPEKEPRVYKIITDIPEYGVSELAPFKYVKGGKVGGRTLSDIKEVTEEELTRRFKQAHNALWGGGELNPSTAFDELDKLIFCKIWDERKTRGGKPYAFQISNESTEKETNEKLYQRIHALYEEGRKKDPEIFREDIRLSREKLRTVVGYLESVDMGKTDLDSKGRAFETFMGSFFRGDFGQYFTPRPIVKFIVDTLPITKDSLVLDTSCGSGGFLLHALDKVRKDADKYYPDGIAKDGKEESAPHYRHWHEFAEKNLFGIEISEQIARTAKMNMIIHGDGHTNVVAEDGLLPNQELVKRTGNHGFKVNHFNFIITNPPFGSKIKLTEHAYMHQYRCVMKEADWLDPMSRESRRNNQNTEVLFIEQCHNYLKEGGYLAIVVPDGILTNSSLQYVRDDIEEMYRIIAVVSMPQTAFQATGAGVKTSVLFLKKHTVKVTKEIRNKKQSLQDSIKEENNYLQQLDKIEEDKKQHIESLKGFGSVEKSKSKFKSKTKEHKESDAYKEWKKEITAEYKKKVDALKEKLNKEYLGQKRQTLDNYSIFMAIAEDIGYDATGRPTNNNELPVICEALKQFISAIGDE